MVRSKPDKFGTNTLPRVSSNLASSKQKLMNVFLPWNCNLHRVHRRWNLHFAWQ
jgi:hypothetical protein